MYQHIRDVLFRFDAETSHELSLDMLGAAERLRLLSLFTSKVPSNPVQVMGLSFDNPVGLAAGLDKNGDYFNALGALGFGFVEIGTITPRPQPGNPQPRLFRIPEAQAIINRMGFNNKGVDHLVAQVKKRRYNGILGINIGKNAVTPVENAVDDYLTCLRKVYDYADYITVNISSPNTPGLRNLQFGDSLSQLLAPLKTEQSVLHKATGRYVPIAVKIAPDMDEGEIHQVAGILLQEGMDGVIATNTTITRVGVEEYENGNEAGGLSGLPVRDKSTYVIKTLNACLGGKLPIIGVGGILDGASAADKIRAGASLVQIYSGFIYEGPALIARAAQGIASYQKGL
ncbi:quinone-dependent dihydroorotate dehydrogenase [Cellvibrio sp. KY-YJ-3]|uniref:quinone-dependent dihydroorotate dehydrogenase n=1 Tax=Cellvibrio sp. KY-YJ-3 TaxID=454662 RepID=UPI001249470D|nr:quinone-dependent dihydroorotate dehydrogenase [Cellvibrio sp. KY-YJ-3]QEY13426.1 quinone-dependent dihydroorotate dehydrogenase [Cellvibrio sp. KY-YJ-3]